MQEPKTTREFVLTEEEAVALLDLCMTSPNRVDGHSQRALRKLAEFCASFGHVESTRIFMNEEEFTPERNEE